MKAGYRLDGAANKEPANSSYGSYHESQSQKIQSLDNIISKVLELKEVYSKLKKDMDYNILITIKNMLYGGSADRMITDLQKLSASKKQKDKKRFSGNIFNLSEYGGKVRNVGADIRKIKKIKTIEDKFSVILDDHYVNQKINDVFDAYVKKLPSGDQEVLVECALKYNGNFKQMQDNYRTALKEVEKTRGNYRSFGLIKDIKHKLESVNKLNRFMKKYDALPSVLIKVIQAKNES